jgi:glucoamylase
VTANHIVENGPDTRQRWEELDGKSPSSVAAEIAGLIAAADIARQNSDPASASKWEATADSWRDSLVDWTFTSTGAWGGHQYFELIGSGTSANDNSQICNYFQEGCFFNRDIVDFGFLELVRLGVRPANDDFVFRSLRPAGMAYDGNSPVQVELPNGDVYFHRYVYDNYGESNLDCSGWPAGGDRRFGRLWPLLSGERGEYELANGRSASVYLQSMADAANVGYLMPEQIWDRADLSCYQMGRPTGSASPLMWAEGQYVRLAQAIDSGSIDEALPVVRGRYGDQR